jgi:hypothetical protein
MPRTAKKKTAKLPPTPRKRAREWLRLQDLKLNQYGWYTTSLRNGYRFEAKRLSTKTPLYGEMIGMYKIYLYLRNEFGEWERPHLKDKSALDTFWPVKDASEGEVEYYLNQIRDLPKREAAALPQIRAEESNELYD